MNCVRRASLEALVCVNRDIGIDSVPNASGNPVPVATKDGGEAKNIGGLAVCVLRAQDEFNLLIGYIFSSINI